MAKTELRSARELSGLTQDQMAEVLECTVPTLAKIEANPEKATLRQFARWYRACNGTGKVLLEKYLDDLLVG